MRKQPKRTFVLAALIVVAGAALRFYGLRIGFPFEFHVDEWFIVDSALGMYRAGTLHPRAFDYPSLIYYVLVAGAHVVGFFREPTSYDLHVFGRAVSATFGTATVAVVYLTGRRAYDERTGLLASAFFAFTVTALRESHYFTTDSVNLFFITLAVYFIVKTGLGDHPRNYLLAGASIGFAAGSKYNGAFLLVPLLFAHAARVAPRAGSWKDFISRPGKLFGELFSGWLLTAAALSAFVFLLTTPYALIDYAAFAKDLGKMSAALSVRIVEGNHHYLGTTPYWYYIENLLFWAMGPILEAACLAGFFYALHKRRRQDIIIALWLVIYFLIVGGWLNKAVRYTLPMLPFLSLFGARMFVESSGNLYRTGRRRASAVVVALAAITLASAFLYALAYMNIYARPHTGIQAVRWTFEHVPEGSTILLEGPTAQERPQPDKAMLIYADDSFDFGARRFRFKYLPVPDFSRKDADASLLRAKLAAALDGVDYIIMSTRWYEGLVNSPEASEVIREYYASLVGGTSPFELAKEITVYPRLFSFELKDDSAELNFRVFDHPKVWVFRRKTVAPAETLTQVENDDDSGRPEQ
ncbi:MAG TPA: glycosyltransferase family 39 protein [Pyrinomonadaceae bacterium]|nr:glycosyltransferase family 39 protein [Pyrinomonadaceae bacterium]